MPAFVGRPLQQAGRDASAPRAQPRLAPRVMFRIHVQHDGRCKLAAVTDPKSLRGGHPSLPVAVGIPIG
jgi:hypothetical protein